MEGQSSVTRSVIDELHSRNIQVDEMEGEKGVTRSILEELPSSDSQPYHMEVEGGFIRSIIDELHSSDMVKRKVKVALLQVSLIKFILQISK